MSRMNKRANGSKTKRAPTNPHSSHSTEKIKSVRASGKNESLFCVPLQALEQSQIRVQIFLIEII